MIDVYVLYSNGWLMVKSEYGFMGYLGCGKRYALRKYRETFGLKYKHLNIIYTEG